MELNNEIENYKLQDGRGSSNFCDNKILEDEKFQNGIIAEDLGSLLQMFEEAAESMLMTSLNNTDLRNESAPAPVTSDNSEFREMKLKSEFIGDQNIIEQETDKLMRDINEAEHDKNMSSIDKEFTEDIYRPSSPFVDNGPPSPSVDFCCGTSYENKKSTDESSWESSNDDQSSDDHGQFSPTYTSGRGQCDYLSRCHNQGGPRRQQGRGRTKKEEAQLYDKLPSYYTVFSRPHRTATGLTRISSISSVKLVSKSGIPDRDRDPSPDRKDLMLDKVPSYQSCFTNSTKYDEDMTSTWKDSDAEVPRSNRRIGGRARVNRRIGGRTRSRSRSRGVARARGGNRILIPTSSLSSEHDGNNERNCKTKFEPRRIVYVGRIPLDYASSELKEIFQRFGKINECTVHFRESGDNYGFVTFERPEDAFQAVENARRIPCCKNFDISFGGRRRFCKADYTDLDGNVEIEEDLVPISCKTRNKNNFDQLLHEALKYKK